MGAMGKDPGSRLLATAAIFLLAACESTPEILNDSITIRSVPVESGHAAVLEYTVAASGTYRVYVALDGYAADPGAPGAAYDMSIGGVAACVPTTS